MLDWLCAELPEATVSVQQSLFLQLCRKLQHPAQHMQQRRQARRGTSWPCRYPSPLCLVLIHAPSPAADLPDHCAALDLKPLRCMLNVVVKKPQQQPQQHEGQRIIGPSHALQIVWSGGDFAALYASCQQIVVGCETLQLCTHHVSKLW